MDISPDTTRRLALIRLLLHRAEETSRQAPPFSTDSINRLHDVAEMFLALAVTHHHGQIPRDFDKYWEVLEGLMGRPLTYRAQMQRFNKTRVSLKHYGVEPAPREIEAARAAVRGLLEDECPGIFGIALEDVALSSFVSTPRARELMDDAERHFTEGDVAEAFADLAVAFREVIDDYEQRKLLSHRRSVFDNVEAIRIPVERGTNRITDPMARFGDAVIKSLHELDHMVMLVGLGVDLRRYGKFRVLTPTVRFTVRGGRTYADRPGGLERTRDDLDFCRDFIISTALHLAEMDYDYDLWAAHQAEGGVTRLRRTPPPTDNSDAPTDSPGA